MQLTQYDPNFNSDTLPPIAMTPGTMINRNSKKAQLFSSSQQISNGIPDKMSQTLGPMDDLSLNERHLIGKK